jgi:hypothetical protein
VRSVRRRGPRILLRPPGSPFQRPGSLTATGCLLPSHRPRGRSLIELWVVAEDSLLVERQAAVRLEVGRDPRLPRDLVAKPPQECNPPSQACHGMRERVFEAREYLEGGQIYVREGVADQVATAVSIEHRLQVTEVLWMRSSTNTVLRLRASRF